MVFVLFLYFRSTSRPVAVYILAVRAREHNVMLSEAISIFDVKIVSRDAPKMQSVRGVVGRWDVLCLVCCVTVCCTSLCGYVQS
jgi:hypothetical protein